MRLSAIIATDLDGGIGYRGALPWERLPADMARFREVTAGRVLLMGRRTWESINRPLPGRPIVVLSSSLPHPLPSTVHLARDLAGMLHMASYLGDEAVVCGGTDLYRELLPRCGRLALTLVHQRSGSRADTWAPWAPELMPPGRWTGVEARHVPAAEGRPALTFLDWRRP